MSKYLVIDFDRYDTHKSKRDVVEADSPTAALAHFLVESYIAEDVEAIAYYSDKLIRTDEGFSSYTGDENDSPTAALAHFLVESYIAEDVEEAIAYYSDKLIHADEGFSSYAGDENDYLIYKLS